MADFARSTFIDAQTTVVSLGAAFAGVAAEMASDALIIRFGGAQRAVGLGQIGLNFITRAVVSSVAYSAAATLMPETSQNFFFGVLFFASNPGLVRDARDIAQIVLKVPLQQSFLSTKPRIHPSDASKPACGSCE